MCGIFGILNHRADTGPDRQRLEATARRLHHRGPDAHGVFADEHVGLVHTRLSLLDLDPRSDQPFWDSTRRYALVYNGEIFNHEALRAELEAEGATFHTTGDTELLLEWLLRRGTDDALTRLEGFFAFALYDSQERTMTLARDRFGIKPLHVYETDERFLFASEISAFAPWVDFEPDLLSISGYLQGHPMPTRGSTFYRRVRIVSPGEVVTIEVGRRSEARRFFRLRDFADRDEIERLRGLSDETLLDEVDERLQDAVRLQLIADAPVGGFCSGGVDSAVVLGIASRLHEHLQVFHVDVVGPDSEHEAALALADYLGLEFHVVRAEPGDFVDLLPETMAHCGHPFTYQPNAVAGLRLARLVREHGVKGVLTGQGSDECFVGYPWRVFKPIEAMGKLLRRPLPMARRILGLDRSSRAEGGGSQGVVRELHSRFETAEDHIETRARVDSLAHRGMVASLDLLGFHLRTVLHVNDCMSMAASVEARPPFLDTRLVRLAVNLPFRLKNRIDLRERDPRHRFVQSKWAVRQIARRYLPKAICERPKRGFPAGAYMRMDVDPVLFADSWLSETLGLSRSQLELLLRRADQPLLARLLHLEVWARVCLLGNNPDAVAAGLRRSICFRG